MALPADEGRPRAATAATPARWLADRGLCSTCDAGERVHAKRVCVRACVCMCVCVRVCLCVQGNRLCSVRVCRACMEQGVQIGREVGKQSVWASVGGWVLR